jgi:hypothetical protein
MQNGVVGEQTEITLTQGNITTSEITVGSTGSDITDELDLTIRGSYRTVGHLDRKLGLNLELIHNVPVALGRVRGTTSVKTDDRLRITRRSQGGQQQGNGKLHGQYSHNSDIVHNNK